MGQFCRHICLLLIVAVAVSCSGRGRVIPKSKFAKIYADMLVADQWVRNDHKLSLVSDTTLFYEPILEEYGYDREDYLESVSHYMKDPESYGKIFKDVKKILEAHILELTAEERARHAADSVRKAIEAMDFPRPPVYRDMTKDTVRFDTVSISRDSAGLLEWGRIIPDTIYHGPAFVLKAEIDSLVALRDSLQKKDSLEKVEAAKKPEAKKVSGLKEGKKKAVAGERGMLLKIPEDAGRLKLKK